GRPDIAVNPLTQLPRAVWSRRDGSDLDIVTSAFDGTTWSTPMFIHIADDADDLDPRIAFRSDGVAVVTWWQNGSTPTVRMAYLAPDGRWSEAGVIPPAGVKARTPEVRQEGLLTIVAYNTPRRVGIATFNIVVPVFADGPTPFPRDNGGPDPNDP